MANIWLVSEGDNPTGGEPWRTLPFSECIARIGLAKNDFLCGLDQKLRFNEDVPNRVRGPRYVIVEILSDESNSFKAGFYKAPMSVEDALKQFPAS